MSRFDSAHMDAAVVIPVFNALIPTFRQEITVTRFVLLAPITAVLIPFNGNLGGVERNPPAPLSQ